MEGSTTIRSKAGTASGSARIRSDVLLGVGFAAAGIALVWHFHAAYWKEPAPATEVGMHQQVARPPAVRPLAVAAAQGGADDPCDVEAMLAPGGAHDGRALVEHPFPGGPRARAKVFHRQAQAATAAGRPRDAERALLAACREHRLASERPTLAGSEVQELLGERYAAAARAASGPAAREALLARARRFLELAAQGYASALGPHAARSREARERLALLDAPDLIATSPSLAPAPASPAGVVRPTTTQRLEMVHTSPRSAPLPNEPSLRSSALPAPEPELAPPRLALAADPELAQLDADLARLRAQAEAVSDDAAGFRQRAELAKARHDRCREAACLRDWYAQRRRELLAEF